jgi:hypothetical protein
MTTFYAVTQCIYDDGRAVTTRESVEADSRPANVYREAARYDYYKSYFDTAKERDQFYEENH